jgi:hypothetical protein
MAKGAESKSKIIKQLLEIFPNSFLYNDGKELRIPMTEGGEMVQIKCTLTCAKECVNVGEDNATPGDFPVTNAPVTVASSEPIKPTEEEKQTVANLLRSLGL